MYVSVFSYCYYYVKQILIFGITSIGASYIVLEYIYMYYYISREWQGPLAIAELLCC